MTLINEIKGIIVKQADALFASVFETYLTGDELARSFWPLQQREPEMPQELIDMME